MIKITYISTISLSIMFFLMFLYEQKFKNSSIEIMVKNIFLAYNAIAIFVYSLLLLHCYNIITLPMVESRENPAISHIILIITSLTAFFVFFIRVKKNNLSR